MPDWAAIGFLVIIGLFLIFLVTHDGGPFGG